MLLGDSHPDKLASWRLHRHLLGLFITIGSADGAVLQRRRCPTQEGSHFKGPVTKTLPA